MKQNVIGSNALADAVERAAAGVVRVEARPRIASSGIAWAPDLVVTADHTLERDDAIRVTAPDGTLFPATVLGREPALDVAVLRIEGGVLQPATLVESESARAGHVALVVSRAGVTPRASLGIVSVTGGEWRTWGGARVERKLCSDVRPYPGFSGSMLADAEGRALGMNTSRLSRGAAVALPAVTLRRIVEQILTHGGVQRGFLGVGTLPVRLPAGFEATVGRPSALLVVSVQAGSPADTAGVLLGDVVVALGATPIARVPDLLSALDEAPSGEQRSLHVLRGGEPRTLEVTLGARDAA